MRAISERRTKHIITQSSYRPLTSLVMPITFPSMTLELGDLDTLKDAAIKKFDDSLASGNGPLDREVIQLQAELEQIYRVVVLLQKNESSLDRVAEIWSKMVGICDDFARRLSTLANRS